MAVVTRAQLDAHRASGRLDEDQIAQEWVNEGGDPKYATVMAKIAGRESGGRVRINNRGTNKNGTTDWGLFQVNDVWRSDPVVGPLFRSGAILTAAGATKAAIHILHVQGPQAWATYNAATDAQYLGAFKGGATPAAEPTAAAPRALPGGNTTDTKGAVTAALLDPRKRMSLASRILENVQSGQYTLPAAAPVASASSESKYQIGSSKGSPTAKPGSPTASGTSEGGLHQTDGLPGYPAHDFFAPSGSRAVAPVSGTVVRLSGHDPKDGPTNGPHGPLGWSVYIKGSDGKEYFLTHMGSRSVKVGQRVTQGQAIGTVADYAKYGTPSHIHMGVSG